MMEIDVLYQQDCIVGMQRLPDHSVDLILTDLPYGRTKNKWDIVIPFEQMWPQFERVAKPNAAIVLFAEGTFAYKLALSNEKLFRYDLIWQKGNATRGFLNAGRMPLRNHEHLLIFYRELPVYNPQKTKGIPSHSRGTFQEHKIKSGAKKMTNNNYGDYDPSVSGTPSDEKYPKSVLSFPPVPPSQMLHPTQKPVQLLEYLIRTYSNVGGVVLDACAGSGSAALACINTERHYICYEDDPDFYPVAAQRIIDFKGLFNT